MEAPNTGSNGLCESAETGRKASMTYGGIGPKLALLCLPYIILSLTVMRRYPEFFRLKFLDSPQVRTKAKVLGFVWLGLGTIFWI